MIGTFFGHRECYGLDAAVLRSAIEEVIKQGIPAFLVGNTEGGRNDLTGREG